MCTLQNNTPQRCLFCILHIVLGISQQKTSLMLAQSGFVKSVFRFHRWRDQGILCRLFNFSSVWGRKGAILSCPIPTKNSFQYGVLHINIQVHKVTFYSLVFRIIPSKYFLRHCYGCYSELCFFLASSNYPGHLNGKSYPSNRPWRPIGLWDIKYPTLSRQSAHS
jgi:hypothetical protein